MKTSGRMNAFKLEKCSKLAMWGRAIGSPVGLKADSTFSIKLSLRRYLLRPHTPGLDLRAKEILAAHGRAGKAAQDGDLADVRECIGDRSLKQPFRFTAQRLLVELLVEALQCVEESLHLAIPGLRRCISPGSLSARQHARPFEEVADVRQDLHGRAGGVAGAEVREVSGRSTQHFSAAIGERGHDVTQKIHVPAIGNSSSAILASCPSRCCRHFSRTF